MPKRSSTKHFAVTLSRTGRATDSPLMNESEGSCCKSVRSLVCTAYTEDKKCLSVVLFQRASDFTTESNRFFVKVILQQAVINSESTMRGHDKATRAEADYY